MRRSLVAALVLAVGTAFLTAGCGGSDGGETSIGGGDETLEELWRAPGEDAAVVAGTSDFAVGRNRVSFLVVDKQSRLVERPTARACIAYALKQRPFAETTAARAVVD